MRISEKEKEEKREFESKRKEADDLEYKINVTVWKINKPKNFKNLIINPVQNTGFIFIV
mgnify:CR=1 FL=1